MVQATIGKPVYVKWVDSMSTQGWAFLNELSWEDDLAPPVIRSLGWVIFENDKMLIIAACDGDDQVGRRIAIPKVAILEVFTLDLERFG